MDKYIEIIKLAVCVCLGYLFGGVDALIVTLSIFMTADYIMGLIVAGVFKKSPKTENGALETKAGLKGIIRKCAMLIIVMIVARLETLTGGGAFCRNTVIMFFIVNEALSILENAGLMGVKYPDSIKNALEILKKRD